MIRRSLLAALVLAPLPGFGPALVGSAAAGPTPARTIVSLEFDHATSDELPGIALAAGHGMRVTLFALSGRLGTPGYMTAGRLRALQRAGDEVGGHTIDHPDLSKLSPAAQRAEICGDRTTLRAGGLRVTDFAYPFGHFDAATPGIVRACGYESARGTGGLASPGGCFGACPDVETVPPADPFDTRTVNSVLDTTTRGTLEHYVTRAERDRGGWVQIVFHHVCDRCDPYAVSLPTLGAFLDWLALRAARGTVVRTVRQVIEAPFRPAVLLVLRAGAKARGLLASRQALVAGRLGSAGSALWSIGGVSPVSLASAPARRPATIAVTYPPRRRLLPGPVDHVRCTWLSRTCSSAGWLRRAVPQPGDDLREA